MERSLNKQLENSFRANWDNPALSDYKGITLHYRDVARRIEKSETSIAASMDGISDSLSCSHIESPAKRILDSEWFTI